MHFTQDPMLTVRQLSKSYGTYRALDAVDLDLHRGEVISVIGPSGSGKSTLIRCLNGLETASAGTIALDGRAVPLDSHRAWVRIREEVGMVFQDYALFPHMTILRNIMLAPMRRGRMNKAQAQDRAMQLLEQVGLANKAHDYPADLSGGQQQRVAIVRAIAMDPRIILFDEPTSALDPETIRGVLDVMRGLATGGMTMIVVTHEIGFARQVAHRLIFMEQGRIVEQGDPATLITRPQTQRLADFLSHLKH